MEFTRKMKEEFFGEIVNGHAPSIEEQQSRMQKALWIAQCIIRDEAESCEMIDFEDEESEEN